MWQRHLPSGEPGRRRTLKAEGSREQRDTALRRHLTLQRLNTAFFQPPAFSLQPLLRFRREFVANYVPTKNILLARAAEAERWGLMNTAQCYVPWLAIAADLWLASFYDESQAI